MGKPIICVDIDNVIGATDTVMREAIRDHSVERVTLDYEDVICFEYWACRDRAGRKIANIAEWHKIHAAFTTSYLSKISVYDGVQSHLERLLERFEIHIATSRLEHGKSLTLQWLSEHRVPYTELHFVNHGEKHLIDRPFLAAVEDDREQGYAFYSRGVQTFLLAHPWNLIGPHSPLMRINDWNGLADRLAKIRVP